MFGLDDPLVEAPVTAESARDPLASTLPLTTSGSVDWVRAIEQIKLARGLDDPELGRVVRLGPARLAAIREGRREPPPAARLRILSCLGIALSFDRLLSVLSSEIQSAAREIEPNADYIRSVLVDPFFDRIDQDPMRGQLIKALLEGIAGLTGEPIAQFASTLALSGAETARVFAGTDPLPFRTKRLLCERFSATTLGNIILSIGRD